MNDPLVISLSPRAGGNSDQAAALFARSLDLSPRPVFLRDHVLEPCTGCGACADDGRCRIGADGAEELFTRLDSACGVVLTAPVYFYHLPSQAKAWIDRAQSRYMARQRGLRLPGFVRPAYVVLVAGRTRGEHLFAGILPTLRYFLEVFDLRMENTLCLRGLDQAEDFSRDRAAADAVRDLARSSGW
ncbi:MAG: flavodoxin family protein [Desulfomicrobium sp.]|nr:flavodoxin family protein [Pseudomonadota bacterium]MBV1714097.1 flavodoxin family protein [Desulfomicrobium sp.]MBU4571634.1 flavodoxin family protein [Pseudomonadota bacterium]MBU4595782.1 flavodoxin family protein [Pseudomonadota bacterium]MBV1721700.1 flavodoxin family protein [Desulfomicrobium sp.]